jgi:hypothetical protein
MGIFFLMMLAGMVGIIYIVYKDVPRKNKKAS